MSTTSATASVEVPCDPGMAFDIFTGDIGSGNGTRVTVEHGGWDRVPSAGPGLSDGYRHGWAELLGFYARNAEAR